MDSYYHIRTLAVSVDLLARQHGACWWDHCRRTVALLTTTPTRAGAPAVAFFAMFAALPGGVTEDDLATIWGEGYR